MHCRYLNSIHGWNKSKISKNQVLALIAKDKGHKMSIYTRMSLLEGRWSSTALAESVMILNLVRIS